MYRVLRNILEILMMFFVLAVCDLVGIKKYAIVLGLSLVFLLLGRKKRWSADVLLCVSLPVFTYLIIGCLSAMAGANIHMTTIKTVMFWTLPLLFVFSLYVFKEDFSRIIDAEFIGSCLAYLVINARFLVNIMKVESIFSFVFGAFFLYYVYKKRWGFTTVSAIFMYLTDKRITMLAAMVALVVMVLLGLFRNDKKLAYAIWGAVMAIINVYLWLIYSGTFEYFCKGIGINTNGRVKIYSQITEWFGESVIYFGKGIGIIERLLEAWNIRSFANLHNDLLKFYIELGIIGLLLFMLSYGAMLYFVERYYGKEKMCGILAMIIYSMTLFATDNVSIYILYLIPFYSILFAILSPNQESKIKIKDKK